MSGRIIDKASVRAFLGRPWAELEALKADHWREALDVDALATYRASEALWERLYEQGMTSNPASRAADLETHVRLRALLDRTAHVKAR